MSQGTKYLLELIGVSLVIIGLGAVFDLPLSDNLGVELATLIGFANILTLLDKKDK